MLKFFVIIYIFLVKTNHSKKKNRWKQWEMWIYKVKLSVGWYWSSSILQGIFSLLGSQILLFDSWADWSNHPFATKMEMWLKYSWNVFLELSGRKEMKCLWLADWWKKGWMMNFKYHRSDVLLRDLLIPQLKLRV